MTKEEQKEYQKAYYQKNKEKLDSRNKTYIEDNTDKIKQYQKEYRQKNKEKQKAYMKDYMPVYCDANKEAIKEYKDKWLEDNKDYGKTHYQENKQYYKEKHKKWCEDNVDKKKELRREYERYKIKTSPLYKIINRTRGTVNRSIKNFGYTKKTKTAEILGCSFEEFKTYLESKFESWMNWGNYGNPKDGIYQFNKTWDIDHIIPLSSANCEEDVIRLNHYTNLQPLCSYTNRWVKRDN